MVGSIPIDRVSAHLGGDSVLGRRIKSISDLRSLVEQGLPFESLNVAFLGMEPRLQSRLKRRIAPRRRSDRLSRDQSERLERLVRVISMAEDLWEDPSPARIFLTQAHPELGGASPIELAESELGAREVEELLNRIRFGLPV